MNFEIHPFKNTNMAAGIKFRGASNTSGSKETYKKAKFLLMTF
jgi:hypothetical protein